MFNTIRDWLKNLFDNKDDLYQLGSSGVYTMPRHKIVYLPRNTENRFRPFFIHKMYPYVRKKHHAKGFTVYIQPGPDDRRVGVSITWCSGKDEFCKKEGRKNALAAPVNYINPREVPHWLAKQYEKLINSKVDMSGYFEKDFYYVLKYML